MHVCACAENGIDFLPYLEGHASLVVCTKKENVKQRAIQIRLAVCTQTYVCYGEGCRMAAVAMAMFFCSVLRPTHAC